MPIKIAMIGAGSIGFTRKLVHDVLAVPELADTTFAFTDISERNLEMVARLCERDIQANRLPASIQATTDRRAAIAEAGEGIVQGVVLDAVLGQFQLGVLRIGQRLGALGFFLRRLQPVVEKHVLGHVPADAEQLRLAVDRQERTDVAESLVSSVEGLRVKGYMSDVDFKRRRETYLENKQNLGALGQQLATRHAELAQSVASLEQLPTIIAEKVQTLRTQLADAEQRVAEIDGRRAYVVRAPITGRTWR